MFVSLFRFPVTSTPLICTEFENSRCPFTERFRLLPPPPEPTPGTSSIRLAKLRPSKGRSSISRAPITWPVSAPCNCKTGASEVTSTLALTAPTFMGILNRARWSMFSSNAANVAVSNPCISTVIE